MIRAGWEVAEAADTRFHIHVAEGQYEGQRTLKEHGATPIRFLDRLGVLGPRMIGVHCVWLDDEELRLMGDRGAGLAYCPSSNMVLGDGITRITEMQALGIRIGLGTDGGCTNNRLSVFEEMRMAALLQKVRHLDGTRLPAEECLPHGHRGRRRAAGPRPRARCAPGGLAGPGRDRSPAIPRCTRGSHLLKNVVYAMSPQAVTDVWVHGQRVIRGRPPGHARPGRPAGPRARPSPTTGAWPDVPRAAASPISTVSRSSLISPSFPPRRPPPRQLGEALARGEADAAALSLADFLRLEPTLEGLPFGIATDGPARSVILFSDRAPAELDGAAISVTDETATSVEILRILLALRYPGDAAGLGGTRHRRRRRAADRGPRHSRPHRPGALPARGGPRARMGGVDEPALRLRALGHATRGGGGGSSGLYPRAGRRAGPRHGEPAGDRGAANRHGLGARRISTYLRGFTYRLGAREARAIAEFQRLRAQVP